MKNVFFKAYLIATLFVLIGWGQLLNAQTLFKDLEPGSNVSSNPQQFTNVNGTVYFITDPSTSRRRALWKTDGTLANTVMVKDSVITTNISDRFMIRGNTGDTLFYTVNQNVQSDTTTELWMVINGSTPTLVTLLTSTMLSGFANGEPRQYVMAGGKLYFQMYTQHGYELWVSDGTAAGTKEVIDLFPGSTSGIYNGGANNVPMAEYKGKVYFQGITSLGSTTGLYSSDGTAAGTSLIKSGTNFNPRFFKVFNNSLYFQATEGSTGLWKSDGTPGGTVNINSIGFNNDVQIFKDNMYYSVGHTMYKSDGSSAGTVVLQDSVGVILGMNNTYFLTRYMKTLPSPPYYEYYFWRSDGTTNGTVRVADSIGNAASFAVLNNFMYSNTLGTSLWESDGTEQGTKKLLSGTLSYPPFILNNTVFFTNFGSGTGYELWSYAPTTTGITESQIVKSDLLVFPNPSRGIFKIQLNRNISSPSIIEIYTITGKRVYHSTSTNLIEIVDVSTFTNGIYTLRVINGTDVLNSKICIQD